MGTFDLLTPEEQLELVGKKGESGILEENIPSSDKDVDSTVKDNYHKPDIVYDDGKIFGGEIGRYG